MANKGTCLSEAELREYLSGNINQNQASRCEEHLTSCKSCRLWAADFASQPDDIFKDFGPRNLDEEIESGPDKELTRSLNAISGLKSVSGLSAMEHLQPDVLDDFSSFKFIRDYRVKRQLGEGGMGRVFLAVHEKLDKKVALKILQSRHEDDDEAISRFKREMKAVGQLEHTNIVRALDAGEEQGIHYLVMEYLQGIDLHKYISEQENRRVCDCSEIIRQAASALAHAHQMGLVHRDIKPSNFILTLDGEIKLLDLGLAQLYQQVFLQDGLTQNGQLVGTIKYMAPEQFGETQVTDFRCDIYSLGATFCELLYGKVPSNQPGQHNDLERLFSSRRDVPKDLLVLLGSMLDPDPANRPSSCETIIEQLSHWCDGASLKGIYEKREPNPWPEVPNLPTPANEDTTPENSVVTAIKSSVGWTRDQLKSWPTYVMILILALSAVILAWPPGKSDPIVTNTKEETSGSLIIDNFEQLQKKQPGIVERLRLEEVNVENGNMQWAISESKTELPPGSYKITLPAPATNELFQEQSFIVKQTGDTHISLAFQKFPDDPFNVWRPKIPTVDSMAEYAFTLGKTTPQGPVPLDYDISLYSHKPSKSDPKTSWIQIEISGDDLTETTYLQVNQDAYNRSEDSLQILQGWTVTDVPQRQLRLKTLNGKKLVVPFDLDKDHLEQVAKEWQINWESRLSTQSFLSFLFDVKSKCADKDLVSLKNPQGPQDWKFKDYYITAKNQTITSRVVGDNPLTIIRSLPSDQVPNSDETPFSILTLSALSSGLTAKTISTAKLTLTDFRRNAKSRDLMDEAELESQWEKLKKIAPPKPPQFLFASIPTTGSWVQFRGTMGKDKIKVKVTAKNRVKDSELCWLEIRSEGGNSRDGFEEEIITLLINETKYSSAADGSSKFEIIRGFYQANDQADDFCFDFYGGDFNLIRNALELAGESTNSGIISPHQVAILMFEANLPYPPGFHNMRSEIRKSPLDPTLVIIDDQNKRFEVDGKRWELPANAGAGGNYCVDQSKDIPFGFGDVELGYDPLNLKMVVELDAFAWDQKIESVEEDQMRELVLKTEQYLKEKSVKIWASEGKLQAGKLVHYWGDKVYLKHDDSGMVQEYDEKIFDDFDKDDLFDLYPYRKNWKLKDGSELEGIPVMYGNDVPKELRNELSNAIQAIQFVVKGSQEPVVKALSELTKESEADFRKINSDQRNFANQNRP